MNILTHRGPLRCIDAHTKALKEGDFFGLLLFYIVEEMEAHWLEG